jgi:hypothetical protein
MANKRPSYLSIRRRQRNIIEGMGTRDIKYAQAAREFGVTRAELRKFTETKPDVLRRQYNRSPVMRKLYAEGERKEARRVLGVKRIRRYQFEEQVLTEPRLLKYPNEKQIGRIIQKLYYQNNIGAQNWSTYTYENNLPNSIKAIRLLWRNDKISDSRYKIILGVWRDSYPSGNDAYYEQYLGEVAA